MRERIEHMSKPMSHIFRHHSNSDEFLPSFHVFSLPRVHLANHSYEELGMRENFRERRQRLVCFTYIIRCYRNLSDSLKSCVMI